MLIFLVTKSLKPRIKNKSFLFLHILTHKLHSRKPARISKDSNLIVEHYTGGQYVWVDRPF